MSAAAGAARCAHTMRSTHVNGCGASHVQAPAAVLRLLLLVPASGRAAAPHRRRRCHLASPAGALDCGGHRLHPGRCKGRHGRLWWRRLRGLLQRWLRSGEGEKPLTSVWQASFAGIGSTAPSNGRIAEEGGSLSSVLRSQAVPVIACSAILQYRAFRANDRLKIVEGAGLFTVSPKNYRKVAAFSRPESRRDAVQRPLQGPSSAPGAGRAASGTPGSAQVPGGRRCRQPPCSSSRCPVACRQKHAAGCRQHCIHGDAGAAGEMLAARECWAALALDSSTACPPSLQLEH